MVVCAIDLTPALMNIRSIRPNLDTPMDTITDLMKVECVCTLQQTFWFNILFLTSNQLFHYYTAVIRPVLEYCAPVWHYALTKSQSQQPEAIQKRAIQIVLNFSRGMPYPSMLFAADLNSLAIRREDISRKFFQDITKSTSCLHHLLPDPKSPSHNSRLRSYEKYLRSYTRTKRYCSFVQYALSHYQDRLYNK